MDSALSSSRYSNGSGFNDNSSSHRHHHRGGGGYHRSGRRGGRGRGRGRGRYNHQHDRRDGGRRPPRGPANRFGGNATTSVDPEIGMLKMLSAMVGKVGERTVAPTSAPAAATTTASNSGDAADAMDDNNEDNCSPKQPSPTLEVARNILELSKVLCGDNAGMFLKFKASTVGPSVRSDQLVEGEGAGEDSTLDAEKKEGTDVLSAPVISAEGQAGPLALLLVECVTSLPLQTPSYAGLTLALHEMAPSPDYDGFAGRCVTLGMRLFSRDLDHLLLSYSEANPGVLFLRCKLFLRYLAHLAKIGIVVLDDESSSSLSEDDTVSVQHTTLMGLLKALIVAASKSGAGTTVALILAQLVLATIPYLPLPKGTLLEQLSNLQQIVGEDSYVSSFAPGVGKHALLLKSEQFEPGSGGEEDDDDDDDDEEGNSAQCCDTLQDLLRTVRSQVDGDDDDEATSSVRFSVLKETPWVELSTLDEERPIGFTGDAIRLTITEDCAQLSKILRNDDVSSNCRRSLQGIVYGRLPIFGVTDQDNDDDDEEEEEEEAAPKNERQKAYMEHFSLVDRFFLSDAIRDSLQSHETHVTATGLERGSPKSVAEQLWAIGNVFSGPGTPGIEYGIVETILALIAQSTPTSSLRHVYLTRVLVELTRLQPDTIPQALVVGISALFDDYMPSLVPTSRLMLGHWLAFHLTNTDYQWPKAYWEHWSSFVVKKGDGSSAPKNSRGDFVLEVLRVMASFVSSPKTIATEGLPNASALVQYIMPQESSVSTSLVGKDDALDAIERDISARVWDNSEDPDMLRDYMIGDEVSESVANLGANLGGDDDNEKWWRSGIVMRAFLQPAQQEAQKQREALGQIGDEAAMDEDDPSNSKDTMTDVLDTLTRYKGVLLACLAKDAQVQEENLDLRGETKSSEGDLLLQGETYVLSDVYAILSYCRILHEACLQNMLKNRLVSPMALMKWALGDNGDGTAVVAPCWWDYGTMAVCRSIEQVIDKREDDDGIGMVVDGADAQREKLERVQVALDAVLALLEYAVQRVCYKLQLDGENRNNLAPIEVDLVEGVKQLVLSSEMSLLSLSAKDGGPSHSDLHNLLENSEVRGHSLGATCRSSGSSSKVELLAQILEAI